MTDIPKILARGRNINLKQRWNSDDVPKKEELKIHLRLQRLLFRLSSAIVDHFDRRELIREAM